MEVYRLFLTKEQYVFNAMNKLVAEGRMFFGYMWSYLSREELIAEIDATSIIYDKDTILTCSSKI